MFHFRIIILVEMGLAIGLAVPGILAFARAHTNRNHRAFLFLSISLSLCFFFDALNRYLMAELIRLTDLYFRISDVFLLSGGLGFVYFATIFPRRGGAAVAQDNLPAGARRRRSTRLMLSLWATAFLLGALSFGPYHVLDRPFLSESGAFSARPGPAFIANRVFLLVCLLLAGYEQVRFLAANERDPRRLHSRYFIYTVAALWVGYVLLIIPLFLSSRHDATMVAQAILFLIAFIFMHGMLVHIGISYRVSLLRNGGLLLLYVIFLLPLLLILGQVPALADRYHPYLIAVGLAVLFVVFHFVSLQLTPLLDRLVFQRRARMEDTVADFNQSVLSLSSGSLGDVRRRLTEFIETHFGPRLLALYFGEEFDTEASSSDQPGLRRDPAQTRIADRDSVPPDVLPEVLVRFLSSTGPRARQPGGMLADLLARAEREGREDVSVVLMGLAALGVEILVPMFDLSRNEREIRPATVILMGLATGGRPMDETDANWLRVLSGPTMLALKNQTLFRSTSLLKEKLEEENRRMGRRLAQDLAEISSSGKAAAFVFQHGGVMSRLLAQVERFAAHEGPVLITGETGSGKGELARMIHGLSNKSGDFVTLNCSAIPADLIENELFGHEKGAYTGATEARRGHVERADRGTLFLDEIGDLPMAGQAKLLRLIQEGHYERVGSSDTRSTDARFIFATNRDLEADVEQGRFRQDLFFRITTFEVRVPPLRERREDMPLLIDHFLWMAGRSLGRAGIKMTPRARELMLRHSWPGNIRELENLIMRAVVLSDSDLIDVDNLPVMFRDSLDFNRKREQLDRLVGEQERLQRELVLEAMERARGNQREAARILNMSRGSLQYRLKQYGLV